MTELYFLKGDRIYLRPIQFKDINEKYLSWLNDPKTNEFSRRRLFPTNEWQAKEYLSKQNKDSATLAICINDTNKHIGNISFGQIKWIHKSAELMILIGDKSEWNKGYARDAIQLLTKHLFETIGLNRIEAGSINPAFVRSVEKLGWKQEGKLRQAYFHNNGFKDIIKVSIIKSDFEETQSNKNQDNLTTSPESTW